MSTYGLQHMLASLLRPNPTRFGASGEDEFFGAETRRIRSVLYIINVEY